MEIKIDPRYAKLFCFFLFCGFLVAAVLWVGLAENYGRAIWNLFMAGVSYFFWNGIELPDEKPNKKKTRR